MLNNPILPGFHPDPSLCRVGDDYYLVTSSFEYFPGLPLYHSRDLAGWRPSGHALTRDSQLPLHGARSSGGIYAPTLRWRAGVFYLVCTNVTGGGHFLVTAGDPAGEWSEPVWLEGQGGIDPSLLFDDDGTVYFTCTSSGRIVQRTIEVETGRFLTEEREVWAGTGGQYPEAPHLYHIGEWYYLLIAEGGTEYGHMVTMARSYSPWGPFEPCPRNPVLTHRSRKHPLQAIGHADLFQAADGRWWAVCLGVRPVGYPPAHHLGRETCLVPVAWDADGWPVFGQDGMAPLQIDLPGEQNEWAVYDDFSAPALGPHWNFRRNPPPDAWSLAARPGALRLTGTPAGLDDLAPLAWVGLRQQHLQAEVQVTLDFHPRQETDEAGLCVLMNERHYLSLGVRGGQERELLVQQRIGDLRGTLARVTLGAGPLTLRIEATPERYILGYTQIGSAFIPLASAETRYLTTEVAGGFTGVYFGLYASGPGAQADFLQFRCRPLSVEGS